MNDFDIVLKADDRVSDVIKKTQVQVASLNSTLNQGSKALSLGGSKALDGLDAVNKRFNMISNAARNSVQFIGDIVPPLKMVSGLTLGLGGAAAAITMIGKGFVGAAQNAYNLDVNAQNAGTSVEKLTEMAGAMKMMGINTDSAIQSLSGLYKNFNDAYQGRGSQQLMSLFASNGVKFELNADGKTVNALKTFENLIKVFPSLSPQVQKSFADALGLDSNLLAVARRSTDLAKLQLEAKKAGLVTDDKTNEELEKQYQKISKIQGLLEGSSDKLKNSFFSSDYFNQASGLIENTLENGLNKKTFSYIYKMEKDLLKAFYASTPKWLYNHTLGKMWGKDKTDPPSNTAAYSSSSPIPKEEQQKLLANMKVIPLPERFKMIQDAERKFHLPANYLKYQYREESAYGTKMFSPAGAMGHFQFEPDTGHRYGLKTQADFMDFQKSLNAAAQYDSDLLRANNGNVPAALASYNEGPGAFKKRGGLAHLPTETKKYVHDITQGLPNYYPAQSMTNNGTAQVEVTLHSSHTGEKRKITGRHGAKITTSMNLT